MSELLKSVPDDWGPKFEGPSGAVTRTRTGPNKIKFIAPSHMALLMFSTQPDRQVALNSDCKVTDTAPVGSVEVVPAGAELFARWTVHKENLLIALDSERLARLARLEFDTDAFELEPPKLGCVDNKALLLGQLIREELLRSGHANEDCLDSLLTLFGTHLLRNYSSIRSNPPPLLTGGLPPSTWRRVEDYIQEHLSMKISISDMAEIAQLSPSHFLRAFRRTAGQPPHQYLLASRLAHARQLVTTTDMPFHAIAKAAGFHSNSHMTAAMRKAWQATPTELRRQDRPFASAARLPLAGSDGRDPGASSPQGVTAAPRPFLASTGPASTGK